MADPIRELALDAVGRNGYSDLARRLTGQPEPEQPDVESTPSRPQTYSDFVRELLHKDTAPAAQASGFTTTPQAVEAPVSYSEVARRVTQEEPEPAVPWPPPAVVGGGLPREAGPPVVASPQAVEGAGFLKRLGRRVARAFGAPPAAPTAEEQMAGRAFAAQAEIEARTSPDWNNLLSDEAKRRYLNVYRRRYGLPPVGELPPPATFAEVGAEEFGTVAGLLKKLPYVETAGLGVDVGRLLIAGHRLQDGKGTAEDFELLTRWKERQAKEARGKTVGGIAATVAAESVPLVMELGTGGAVTRLGAKAAAKGAEKLVGQSALAAMGRAAGKVATAASEATIPRIALHAAVKTAERGIPTIALRTAVETMRARLPGYDLVPGDKEALAYAMTAPPQPMLSALRDSLTSSTIEVYSEFTGASLGRIAGRAAQAAGAVTRAGAKLPVARVIAVPAEHAAAWAGNLRTGIAAALQRKFPNKYLSFQAAMGFLHEKGYHQPIQELGEEVIADLMEDASKRTIEALGGETRLKEFQTPEWRELQGQFLGFLIPGAVAAGGSALMPEARPFPRKPATPGLSQQFPPAPEAPSVAEQVAGPPISQQFPAARTPEPPYIPPGVRPPSSGAAGAPEENYSAEELAAIPLHRLPQPVAKAIQDEAAMQLQARGAKIMGEERIRSDEAREALRKIVADKGLDKGAAVQAEKRRLLEHLMGLKDFRTVFERDIGVPERDPDPIIDAYLRGATEQQINQIAAELGYIEDQPLPQGGVPLAPGGYPADWDEPTGTEIARGVSATEEPLSGRNVPLQTAQVPSGVDAVGQALEAYEGTGEIETIGDLVDEVESLVAEGKAPADLQGAVDQFREEQAYDRDLAGRGDMDAAEEQFLAAIRTLVGGPTDAEKRAKVPDVRDLEAKLRTGRVSGKGGPGQGRQDRPQPREGRPAAQEATRGEIGPMSPGEAAGAAGAAGTPVGVGLIGPGGPRLAAGILPDLKFQEGGDAVGRGEWAGWLRAYDRDNPSGQPIGYVDYAYYDKELFVKMIAVEPPYRRRGVARALIHELLKRSPEATKIEPFGDFATKEGQALWKSIVQTLPKIALGRIIKEEAPRERETVQPGEVERRPGQGPTDRPGAGGGARAEGRAPQHVREARPAGEAAPVGPGSAEPGGGPAGEARGGERPGGGGVRDRESGVPPGPVVEQPRTRAQAAMEAQRPPSEGATKPEPPTGVHGPERGGLTDFVITNPADLFVTGKKTIFKRNVAAIEVLKKLQAEKRQATDEERAILVRYQGWGSVSEPFAGWHEDWRKEVNQLRELLSDEEHKAAQGSTKNAMYTPPEIVTAMWQALARMGFTGGSILEPSAGVGHFLGLEPAELGAGSRRVAIEKDAISAAIAAAVYPASDVRHTPFEDALLPKAFFDVAIGNVPFGELLINDRRYPKKLRKFIHDYFFVRALDLVRPGGIVAFVTTKGTMDKIDDTVRAFIAEQADLVGAVRLNEKSLPGTEVIADILFLRRRGVGEGPGGEAWVNSRPYEPLQGKYVNEYFIKHPEMVLGEIQPGSLYAKGESGPTETTVKAPAGFDLARDVGAALERLPADVFGKVSGAQPERIETLDMIASPTDLPRGAYFIEPDGTVVKSGGAGQAAQRIESALLDAGGAKAVDRVRAMVRLRDATLKVLRASIDPEQRAQLPELQKDLNRVYDRAQMYGFTPVHHAANTKLLADDPMTLSVIAAIEKYDPKTRKAVKGDIFTRPLLDVYERPTSAATAGDALAISLNESNRVDLPRIAGLLGIDEAAARARLVEEGLVYEVGADALVIAAEYLSGNVRVKLQDAEALAKADPRFTRNVEALKAVQPEDLPPSRIPAVIGAPWIPEETIADFIVSVLGENARRSVSVRRSAASGRWHLAVPSWAVGGAAATETWGTRERNFVELVDDELNMRIPTVKDSFRDSDGKKREVVNPEASEAARAKLTEIREHFQAWLWGHAKWSKELHRRFNDELNTEAPRKWDGSHLTFPGMNPQVKLYPYQKDAVYRVIASPNNTILNIAVGGGKTFTLVAAAMELLRLRHARKPVIVVERATLNGFIKMARDLYPAGNFVALSVKDLEPARRARTLAKVAAAERTVFIIPHEQFSRLPVGEKTIRAFYAEMLAELEDAIEQRNEADDKAARRSVKQMEKARDNLTAKLEERIAEIKRVPTLTFEELGVDWVMYDESQRIKNLMFVTQMQSVRGLGAPAGNQRTTDAYVKIRHVQGLQSGRGVVFSTGTPVDNSISEIYSIQRYLQPAMLKATGIASFDDWVRMFAVAAADIERVAGRYKSVQRLRKFRNLRVLNALWGALAHTVEHEDVARTLQQRSGSAATMPEIAENTEGKRSYEIIKLEQTAAQRAYAKVIAARVEAIEKRRGPPKRGDDIMLSVITDEKKAALDMRLVDAGLAAEPGNKLLAVAARVGRIYKETTEHRLTQLIFVNQGAPGSSQPFALYRALVRDLVEAGVPAEEIAIIHEAASDDAKLALFDRVNRGEIRVLIGSMAKMGVGVNVQERVVALHQMEPAWTPGLLVQMEGRAIRQGNINWADPTTPQQVRLRRYVAKGSSDEFMYSLLAAKHKVNSDFLSGRLDADEIEDVDIHTAAFQLAMAESSESKQVLEWTKADQELRRLQAQARYHRDAQMELGRTIVAHKAGIDKRAKDLAAARQIAKWVETLPPAKPFLMDVGGKTFEKMTEAGQALYRLGLNVGDVWTRVASFRGVAVEAQQFQGRVALRLAVDPEHAEAWARIAPAPTTVAGKVMEPVTEGQLRAWLVALGDMLEIDPDRYQKWLTNQKTELAELERNLGKPFAQQKELDALSTRVRALADEISKLAENNAEQAVGNAAADLGEEEEGEEPDQPSPPPGDAGDQLGDNEENGTGGGGNFWGPKPESLLPPTLTPEQREWLRQNWHGNNPLFGMGAATIGAPPVTGVWGAYTRAWDATVDRLKNMKTERGQRAADLFARLLYDLDWKLDHRTRNAFEKVRGAEQIAEATARRFKDLLDVHVAAVRAKGVGKPWPAESWEVIRRVAKAVIEGGHRKPETLPPDMRRVWDAHFAPWLKRIEPNLPIAEKRAERKRRMRQVQARINALHQQVIGAPAPKSAWDVYALTEHRVIQDVIRGKRPYGDISPEMQLWIENFKAVTDQLTDEILNTPYLMDMAKSGGLVNIEEIIELRRSRGLPYLRRLYQIAREPESPLAVKNKLLGPRLTLGMFKPKRADEELWTVRMASGQMLQFPDRDAAIDFVQLEREKWREQYGKSVEQRVVLIKPLSSDQVEWLGPVEDMRVLLTRTLVDLWVNVETAKLFRGLAETEAIDESDYNALPIEEQRLWRKLPDSGGLGELADKYVPEAVFYNLSDVMVTTTGILSTMWRTYLQIFKSVVVLTSAKTWMNNLYGQVFFWILRGINPLTHFGVFKEAAGRLARGLDDPTYAHLVATNNLNGGWDRELPSKMLGFMQAPGGSVTGALVNLYEFVRNAGQVLGRAYSFIDDLSIMASWIQDREIEELPEELALENLRYFQNYRRLGRAAKYLRVNPLGDPFVAFSDQAMKITIKGLREHPGRVLAFYAAPAILNFTTRIMLGVTDEEMQILDTAAQRRGRGPLGGVQGAIDRYFQPLVPVPRDARGRLHTLDMRWMMPLASDFRVATGPGGVGLPFLLKQPVVGPLLEAWFNRELYRGFDVAPAGEGSATQLWRLASHVVWRSVPAPSLATRAPLRLYRAATGESGEPVIQVILKEVFGINILPVQANRQEAFRRVKAALGEKQAHQAVKLIQFYERYKRPGEKRITIEGVRESIRSDRKRELEAARR